VVATTLIDDRTLFRLDDRAFQPQPAGFLRHDAKLRSRRGGFDR
jgi:hypothetical protein